MFCACRRTEWQSITLRSGVGYTWVKPSSLPRSILLCLSPRLHHLSMIVRGQLSAVLSASFLELVRRSSGCERS